MKRLLIGLCCGAVLVAVLAHAERPAGITSAMVPDYIVTCPRAATDATRCTVDDGTYRGWQIYSTHCAECHGAGARGTGDTPGLIGSLNGTVDYDGVHYVIMHGHRGDNGIMPKLRDDPHVVPNIDRLYQYLKALAEGALPPGTPNKAAPPRSSPPLRRAP